MYNVDDYVSVMNGFDVHPTAIVESQHIGEATRIWAYAHVLPGAAIGRNCNLGDHVFVEGGVNIGDNVTIKNNVCVWEGVTLEDDVFVGPSVVFTNDRQPRSPRMPEARERYHDKTNWLVATVVERGATLGANATLLGGIRIGRYSFVAAGATVTRNVAPFALVAGCPARPVGHVCRCGTRLGPNFPSTTCPSCGTGADIFEDS